jgi:hypothetical protein
VKIRALADLIAATIVGKLPPSAVRAGESSVADRGAGSGGARRAYLIYGTAETWRARHQPEESLKHPADFRDEQLKIA